MFADPKNPLTADLIKEFKAVSKLNQPTLDSSERTKSSKECFATESASKLVLSRIRANTLNECNSQSDSKDEEVGQTRSSEKCYISESASKLVLSRIRANTLNRNTPQADSRDEEVGQTKSSDECCATESASKLVLSRIRANTLNGGTSHADSRDEEVGHIHEISKSDFFSAVNLAVVSSPTLRKEPQLPTKTSKGKRFNKFLTIKSKSKSATPPVERNQNELRTKSLSGLVDDPLTKCKDKSTGSLTISLDSWDSDLDDSEECFDDNTKLYYEEPNSPVFTGFDGKLTVNNSPLGVHCYQSSNEIVKQDRDSSNIFRLDTYTV